jgi:Secretion system C-terminal sorting domain
LHSLRTYMGDSLFFGGLKYFLTQYSFKDVNTVKLNQALNTYSGKNYNSFFNDWVKQPGFANFTIDSFSVWPLNNNYSANVYIRQRKHKTDNYYSQVPIQINFYKKDFTYISKFIELNNQCGLFNFNLPFEPAFICIDEDHLLSDASTPETIIIKTNGTKISTQAKARITIKSITTGDSILARMEHHWVAPDRNRISLNGYILNNARYWRIDGINLNKATGYLGFQYNANAANSYLDSTWIKGSESNIKLFYRKNAQENWQLMNDSLVTGSLTDRAGFVYSKELKSGDFTFGFYNPNATDVLMSDAPNGPCLSPLSIEENTEEIIKANEEFYKISPNPSTGQIQITSKFLNKIHIYIFDTLGQLIKEIESLEVPANINLNLNPGIYKVTIMDQFHHNQTSKIIIQ